MAAGHAAGPTTDPGFDGRSGVTRRTEPGGEARSAGRQALRVAVIGGGPGGLYAAALLKRLDPAREVTVWERNAPDDTFGFGVVLSDETLGGIEPPGGDPPHRLGRPRRLHR
ncbi:NAD(P)-binding protein, partial [Streptomyces sp. NPDC001226]